MTNPGQIQHADAVCLWLDVYKCGLLDKKSDPAAYLVKMITEEAPALKAFREAEEDAKRGRNQNLCIVFSYKFLMVEQWLHQVSKYRHHGI